MTCGGERRDRGRRCGVLDVAVPVARQPQQLRQPVHHQVLQFGGGRGCPPNERHLVERRGDEFGHDSGWRRRRREVRKETRVLPMSDAGKEQVQIGQDRVERFGLVGRVRRQRRTYLAGGCRRQHWHVADAVQVAGSPFERLRAFDPQKRAPVVVRVHRLSAPGAPEAAVGGVMVAATITSPNATTRSDTPPAWSGNGSNTTGPARIVWRRGSRACATGTEPARATTARDAEHRWQCNKPHRDASSPPSGP